MKRRFENRRVVNRSIEVISSLWDEPLQFFTGDLSPRGAYVRSELFPDMGEHIVCSFDLGPNRKFDFFGEIVRVNLMRRKEDMDFPGFGIHFLDARPFDRLKIRSALKRAPMPVMRSLPGIGRRIIAQQR